MKNGELILYNSASGALATFEDQEEARLVFVALEGNSPELLPSQFLDDMASDGYLVESNSGELKEIERIVALRQKQEKNFLLSIMPNLSCNFDCPYCFEEKNGKTMSPDIIKRVKKMFNKISESAKSIRVNWYGGEPLLSFHLIREMNDGFMDVCSQLKIDYRIAITTNGYLLDDAVVDYLKNTPLDYAQITLDGPREMHNKTRPLKKDASIDTFGVIMDNLTKAVNSGLRAIVRVNITNKNIDSIPNLYHFIEKSGLKNRVEIILQPVVSSTVKPCESTCLLGCDAGPRIMDIYQKMASKGWIIYPDPDMLQIMGSCVAEFPNRYIIGVEGRLYVCGQTFSVEEEIGFIDESGEIVLDTEKQSAWMTKNPLLFEECRECRILPMCMGGCNMKRLQEGNEDYCFLIKHDLHGLLQVLVENQNNLQGK